MPIFETKRELFFKIERKLRKGKEIIFLQEMKSALERVAICKRH